MRPQDHSSRRATFFPSILLFGFICASGMALHAQEYAAYIVPSPVSFIITTSPETTIANHGIPFTSPQLEAVRLADNVYLSQGFYHLFKMPNTGSRTIRWTGYATGNHQVFFSYWDGTQFVIRDIRDAIANASYEITVNRPLTESYIYVLLNCTSGQIITDQLSAGQSARPSFTEVPGNQTIPEDSSTGALPIKISSPSGVVSASSPDDIMDSTITIGGSGTDRTVTVTPAANKNGSATIILSVCDENGCGTASFTVTVTPANDAPALAPIPDLTVAKNRGGAVPVLANDPETSPPNLTFTATSSDETLIPNNNISLTSTGGSRILEFSSAQDQSGTAAITVTVTDDGEPPGVDKKSSSTTFAVTVTGTTVNEGPPGWKFRMVKPGFPLTDLATAENVLNNTSDFGGQIQLDTTADRLAVNQGYDGTFLPKQSYPNGITPGGDPGDFIAFSAATDAIIPVGNWQIAIGSDDGGSVVIPGVEFSNSFNNDSVEPDRVSFTGFRSFEWTGGSFSVSDVPLHSTITVNCFESQIGDGLTVAIRNNHDGANSTTVNPADGWVPLTDGVWAWNLAVPSPVGDGKILNDVGGLGATGHQDARLAFIYNGDFGEIRNRARIT